MGCLSIMKTLLVESAEKRQRVYNTLLLDPKYLGIFSSELAVKVINELARQPMCAMDIAKKLRQHEQKIYYHIRKMRDAGIVKLNSTEARYGMTAKIFELVSPVIAAKLHEDGYETTPFSAPPDPLVKEFLNPFIKDGALNAVIVFGDVRPHGKYEGAAHDGAFVADFMMLLGKYANTTSVPCYKMDSRIKESDLKNNLIIIGNPKVNTVAQTINNKLPIRFDTKTWSVVSTLSNKVYDDDFVGVIIKCDNPFNRKKKLLFLGGKRSRGTIVSTIAITSCIDEIMKGNINDEKIIAKVAKGVDRDADGFVDHVHFLE